MVTSFYHLNILGSTSVFRETDDLPCAFCDETEFRTFMFADFEQQTFHMDFCGSTVMRTTECFSFNKFRRWLLVELCFGSGWKGRAYSVQSTLFFFFYVFEGSFKDVDIINMF